MPTVSCPNCKQEFDVDADQLGKICMCPKCGVTFTATAPQGTQALNPNNEDDVDGDNSSINASQTMHEGWDTIKTTNWYEIIPLKEILSWENLENPLLRYCLFIILFPLLFSTILPLFKIFFKIMPNTNHHELGHFACIMFYFSMVLLIFFASQLKAKIPLALRCMWYLFLTATTGIMICFALQEIPSIASLYVKTDEVSLISRLLGFCLAVGPIEEFIKMLPLLIFGLKLHKLTNERNGLLLGMASGFGFAVAEGEDYIQRKLAASIIGLTIDDGGDTFFNFLGEAFNQMFVRSLSLSLLHAAWCAIIGYTIGSCVRNKVKTKWPIIVVAWGISALLHGLYDTFCGSIIGATIIITVTLTIFIGMFKKAKEFIPESPQPPIGEAPVTEAQS